jgi:hypothetical protein
MARLVPSVYDDSSPPGEKRIFELIREAPGTEEWIVLHSLLLAKHVSKPMGEIDFAFLIPGRGIICLEVKSHRAIEFTEGIWLYGALRKRGKNPFSQAGEGMFTVRERIAAKSDNSSSIPFAHGVCFPFASFLAESIEWARWQIIDHRDLFETGLKSSLEKLLHQTTRQNLTREKGAFVDPEKFTVPVAENILSILRPSFELVPSTSSKRAEGEKELLKLTNQQYLILDAVESNPRLLISGPAGTGKTVLTNEAVRRALERGQLQLAYFCYNKNLAGKLQHELGAPQGVVLDNIDAWLTDLVGKADQEEVKNRNYFEVTLPSKALDVILSSEDLIGSVDFLVVDEAQDILKPHYLEVLDLLLKGGLRGGRWVMGGDFIHQQIYSQQAMAPTEFLAKYSASATELNLTKNCRNSPEIGTFVSQHTLASPLYDGYLRTNYEQNPSTRFFKSEEEQRNLLLEEIQALREAGLSLSDIVILSPRRNDSAGELLEKHGKTSFKVRRYGKTRRAAIRYSTIHGFKGLESDAIIVTDVHSLSEDYEKTLLYVALSRAQNYLALFCHQKAKPELRELFLNS